MVSLSYRNTMLYILEDGRLFGPGWLTIDVEPIPDTDRATAYKPWDKPKVVRLDVCGCGELFAIGLGAHTGGLCKTCDRERKTLRQRQFRQHKRRTSTSCVECSSPMESARTTKKYCSAHCRVSAKRKRDKVSNDT